jgi:hypothetical protein
MPLPNPRDGTILEFHSFPRVSYEVTVGDPEKIIWSSIKHLCAIGYSEKILYGIYGISNSSLRSKIAENIKLYIKHAFDFYEAGKLCQPNTAPLFYYYCFLHLGKALCEIKNSSFHKKRESYRHGISWKPNPKYLVHIPTEVIYLSGRGVWQIVYESVTNQQNLIIPHIKLPVKELFALCPEISIEYQRIFGDRIPRVEIVEAALVHNPDRNEVWIRFSVYSHALKRLKISRAKFIELIKTNDITYKQIVSKEDELWTFESEPKKYGQNYRGALLSIFQPEINNLNIYSVLDSEELKYYIPIINQKRIPLRLPQIMVLYSLIYWLSSLVRYDPHSLFELQDSEYWILIDGFMNQSIIWLLELFEWEFYQAETILKTGR